MQPLSISHGPNGIPVLNTTSTEFPVDGDSLSRFPGKSRSELKRRAKAAFLANPSALAEARSWLGIDGAPGREDRSDAAVQQLISDLYTGGTARFIAEYGGRAAA